LTFKAQTLLNEVAAVYLNALIYQHVLMTCHYPYEERRYLPLYVPVSCTRLPMLGK